MSLLCFHDLSFLPSIESFVHQQASNPTGDDDLFDNQPNSLTPRNDNNYRNRNPSINQEALPATIPVSAEGGLTGVSLAAGRAAAAAEEEEEEEGAPSAQRRGSERSSPCPRGPSDRAGRSRCAAWAREMDAIDDDYGGDEGGRRLVTQKAPYIAPSCGSRQRALWRR